MTPEELTVTIEALREYRLRVGLDRRAVIDPLVITLITQLAEGQ